jgi:hypothetical protein
MMNKFNVGDCVYIKKELPKSMSHFLGRGKKALITGITHEHDSDGNPKHIYSYSTTEGAWYPEETLELMARNNAIDFLGGNNE